MTQTIEIRSERRPGWFWADNAIYDIFAPVVGIHAFAVYIALCRHADWQGKAFAPKTTLSVLAKQLHVSEPTICKALKTLANHRLITITKRREGKIALPNLYTLTDVASLLKEGGVVNDVEEGGKPPLGGVVNDVEGKKTQEVRNKEDSSANDERLLEEGLLPQTAIPEEATPIALPHEKNKTVHRTALFWWVAETFLKLDRAAPALQNKHTAWRINGMARAIWDAEGIGKPTADEDARITSAYQTYFKAWYEREYRKEYGKPPTTLPTSLSNGTFGVWIGQFAAARKAWEASEGQKDTHERCKLCNGEGGHVVRDERGWEFFQPCTCQEAAHVDLP